MDRLGERVGASKVDPYGERIILENLPGAHWSHRHNAMELEVASLCAYAGIPAEREPFGLFGHLLPQQALSTIQQNQRSQVLRPDIRMDVPNLKVKPPATGMPAVGHNNTTAQPAPVSQEYSGSLIAKIKVLGKGVRAHYKPGTRAVRAVDSRAAAIPADYHRKAAKMDQIITGEE